MSQWVVVCVTHHMVAKGVQPMQETSVYGMFDRRLDAFEWNNEVHDGPGEHYFWVINNVTVADQQYRCIHDDPLEGKGAVVPSPRRPLGLDQAGLQIRL